MQHQIAHFVIALVPLVASCASAPSAPPKPAYQPSYRYSVKTPSMSKVDVTVGLAEPMFIGEGVVYEKENKDAREFRDFVRAVTTSFNELFTSKGFGVMGPYKRIDDLTFPEKRGMSFVVYPEIDFTAGYRIENEHPETEVNVWSGSRIVIHCTAVLQPSGSVQLVAEEPLSRQKLWVLDVNYFSTPATTTFPRWGALRSRSARNRFSASRPRF